MAKSKAVVVHVTHGNLQNDATMTAIGKLVKSPSYPNMRTVKKMSEIQKSLEPVLRSSVAAYIGLIKAYAVLDDKGNPVAPQGQPGGFTIPDENMEKWNKSVAAFKETKNEVTFAHGKMTLDEVAKVGLTPQDLAAIDFLFE